MPGNVVWFAINVGFAYICSSDWVRFPNLNFFSIYFFQYVDVEHACTKLNFDYKNNVVLHRDAACNRSGNCTTMP